MKDINPITSLRIRIALLVFAAMVSLCVLSLAASYSVQNLDNFGKVRAIYDLAAKSGGPVIDVVPVAGAHDAKWKVIAFAIGLYTLFLVGMAFTVSILVANLIARPLIILEGAIGSVDPHGFIPKIAERGGVEDQTTAKMLNKLSDRLHATMESRMRLVAAAGHDLRTPITRMRLRAEFIDDDRLRDVWLQDLDEISIIAESAITLVQEEVAPGEGQLIELRGFITEIVAELKSLGHSIDFGQLVECHIIGCPMSMKRALSNLLINGATHGRGCCVSVSLVDGFATVEIVDEGPGIPNEMLERAFEPFFRVSSVGVNRVPGAGLGLSIVKSIINRHRGTITIANRKPVGLYQQVQFQSEQVDEL